MEKFSYDNATTEDLWRHLSACSDVDVGGILGGWIRELGFPVVRASCHRAPNSVAILRLEQERFSSASDGAGRRMVWAIPVRGVYVDRGGRRRQFETLFDKRTTELELTDFDWREDTCFLKLNPRLTGFYRVQYGELLFCALLRHLGDDALTAIDRVGLFDDQVAMALSEGGSTERILRMVELFGEFERSETVWRSVCGVLQQLRTLTWARHGEDVADAFDIFVANTLRPVLDRVGLSPRPGESSNDSRLRASLLPVLAGLREQAVLAFAKEQFKLASESGTPVPGNLRDGVYRGVMVDAGRQASWPTHRTDRRIILRI